MKKYLISVFALLLAFNALTQGTFISKSNLFYSKVIKDGLVDYNWISENPAELNELVQLIKDQQLNDNYKNQYDFLLNAYNVLVIEQIVKNYPLNSPLDISGFYDKTEFNIGGNSWTLDHLENKVIRPTMNDPRVHFSLVCGALGCPRIFNLADSSMPLEKHLESGAKSAMNNGWFVFQEGNKLMVSEIFKWFEDDFGGKNNIITYINKYSNKKYDQDLKIAYYPYDWTLNGSSMSKKASTGSVNIGQPDNFNLQTFTGGSLLKKGQADITLFNTIYTQSQSNWNGTRFSGFRESFYTHSLQGTYGVSKSGRFNIGGEINFKASGRSVDSTASSVVLPLDYTNTDTTRVGISNVGVRLKFQPFKSEPDFSIQSTFYIPTVANAEGLSGQENSVDNRYFLDWDRFVWWNQFFYSNSFSDFQIFSSVEALFRFGRNEFQSSSVDLPAKVFFSYFPSNKITVYAMTEHVPRFRYNSNTTPESIADINTHSGNYTASGAGFKYQFGQNLNIELLYTNFWRSKFAGLGNTFNIGIKYLVL